MSFLHSLFDKSHLSKVQTNSKWEEDICKYVSQIMVTNKSQVQVHRREHYWSHRHIHTASLLHSHGWSAAFTWLVCCVHTAGLLHSSRAQQFNLQGRKAGMFNHVNRLLQSVIPTLCAKEFLSNLEKQSVHTIFK